MRFIVLLILLGLLISLQYSIWIKPNGLKELQRLNRIIAQQQEENQGLLERNQFLNAEVQDLKNGLEAIEERARSELGMIKKNETFFQVIEK
ncbi:cell division protein FtsB [Candidatus Nitrosacidococcus tergens]|uniref:Cell division protein FtsB n=1 Tax=Candidatus Nitrosacidococcus tergens TaxID=553981 RepID=A0A7G1Q9B3_9GAMM|nr:cell division protein FtsB [Candidatus Nitrosacidococcus tergens]CAB1275699.1 cell division protein [Candidatus Nitrosacidococcus tergens]